MKSIKDINKTATMHKLSNKEAKYFEDAIKAINKKFEQIVQQNNLTGSWTISADYKWLVKKGD